MGLVDPQTLLSIRHLDAAARLLIAAKVGDKNPVRLIDNGEVCPGG